MSRDPVAPPAEARTRWLAWAGGLAALLPFLLQWNSFAGLFWFGDEWDLLDQIDRHGVWSWSWQVFAENFVPVFKLVWAGALQLGDGSYLFMLACLWLTHAANTVLLGRLLGRVGLDWPAVLLAQTLFALTPANWETLAWSVQWSAVLATTFLLLAGEAHLRLLRHESGPGCWRWLAVVVLCCTASAWSFSRGVLTGGVLALAVVATGGPAAGGRRWLPASLCLVPSIATAALIMVLATGNHQRMAGHLAEAAQYGLAYFALNPFHAMLEMDSWGWRTSALLALCKLSLLAWGLWRARGGLRLLLALAVAYDLGNSALLGLGRYHTGLPTTISSRYQYGSLLATVPFLALGMEALLARLKSATLRPIAAAVVLVVVLLFTVRRWPAQLPETVGSRGLEPRRTLLLEQAPERFDAGGIPSMTTLRAKELLRRHNLH